MYIMHPLNLELLRQFSYSNNFIMYKNNMTKVQKKVSYLLFILRPFD